MNNLQIWTDFGFDLEALDKFQSIKHFLFKNELDSTVVVLL